MEKLSREGLLSIVDEVMNSGEFTYKAIADKLNLSTERVRQLFKKFELPDFKDLRYSLEIKKLNALIQSGEVENYSLQELFAMFKSRLTKPEIAKMVEEGGRKFKSKKSKFLQCIDKLEESGFKLKDHTLKEIYNELINHGITAFNIVNVSNELSRYDLEFKYTLPRKSDKHDNDFVRLIEKHNVDWNKTTIIEFLNVLKDEGELEKIDPKLTEYVHFYPALRRYGLIPLRRVN